MLTELAHFGLILTLGLSIIGAIAPLVGAHFNRSDLMQIAPVTMVLQFILVAFAFVVLSIAFATSDFTLDLVYRNSHSLKPLVYKISGVWGNHEGSLLLWVLILTLFGALAAVFGRNLPETLHARVLGVQSMITAAFMAFIIVTSNPLLRLANPPMDGRGLNPMLQDFGLIVHPPLLYVGYVGLSVTFSFAIAALLEGRVDAAWGRWVRPWTLAAWLFLTGGIGLGSWWAYYELGWGGFWFWDPVENASLMPWLIAAALLHSAIVVEKRETLKSWTILLAILAFGFSLIGTFIVRSGVLTSVHAFANDPERGVFILMILGFFMGGALILFALRAGVMESRTVFSLKSRESALVANNVLLAISCFVVFIGTVWPLIAELAFDRRLSVGPPFFNMAFTPFFIVLALILPIGSVIPWKRAKLAPAAKRLIPWAVFVIALAGLAYAVQTGKSLLGPIGLALGAWIVSGVLVELWTRTGGNLGRLARLPRADWGKAAAHIGLGITIFGVAGLTAWTVEDIRAMAVGETAKLGRHEITLVSVDEVRGPNYISTMSQVDITTGGKNPVRVTPEKRYYPVAQMPTTEAGISSWFTRDVYITVGEQQEDGKWAMRSYIKPFANWIWWGTFVMALGGILSLTDRRYRVAAGAAKKTDKTAAKGVPAE
ncbi:MAG: heme lyase CcmF/NrfE family subunit [Planktomarina sp.]